MLLAAAGCEERVDPLDIGSKNFTENMLLAEMTAQLAELQGIPVERTIPLGTTFETFESLKQGVIDLYPEYNGTGLILLGQTPVSDGDEATGQGRAALRRARARLARPLRLLQRLRAGHAAGAGRRRSASRRSATSASCRR